MKFRKVAALSLASVMALSLAACGGNSGGDSKGSDDSSAKTEGEGDKAEGEKSDSGSSSDAELSVSIWDTNQEPGIKEILADFTEQTGIKTKLSVVKWDEYWTMLEAGAQGGSLPDVFWMHSNESRDICPMTCFLT